jgi:hypothetical protein
MPGGSCVFAGVSLGAAEPSEQTRGWMVAEAGPATANINAITNATVTIKTMRFIGATSF